MKNPSILLVTALALLAACNKPSAPSAGGQSPAKSPDAVELKLQEYAGASSTNCGRLDVHATETQSKAASDCAMQSSQGKRPFYVTYDMPGMTVGVAGNVDGKLYTVQAQGSPSPSVTAEACPAQLRVASSGRVTCFAPGDMGSMSGSHAGGAVAPGMENPHGSSAKPPSN